MTACDDHFEGTAAMWAGSSPVRTDLCTCAVLGLRHWMLEDGYSHLGFDCWFDVQSVGLRVAHMNLPSELTECLLTNGRKSVPLR
jgi:hypothetical protein